MLFATAAVLIEDLSTASREGCLRDALTRYVKPHVLVVDEVGHLTHGDDAASVLHHVVNERHVRRRAMSSTTNKTPKPARGAVLHHDDLAEAIVDRILERGRVLRLDGPSVRTKHSLADEAGGEDGGGDDVLRISGKKVSEFPEPTRSHYDVRR